MTTSIGMPNRHSQRSGAADLDVPGRVADDARVLGRPKKPRRKREARPMRPPPPEAARAPAPPETTRERMIEGAAELLSRRGLQATSFSEVLAHTDAPRGSVYHHFPGGKDEMVRAALDFVSAKMGQVIDRRADARAEEITALFLRVWRSILVTSRFEAGCAVLAVTVAAESPELRNHAAGSSAPGATGSPSSSSAAASRRTPPPASPAMLIAASEGAVVLSRGEKSLEPFDLVAAQLLEQVRRTAG